jgi:hypothetical protein
MIDLRRARVLSVRTERPGAVELDTQIEGDAEPSACLAHPDLVGPVRPGDEVLLNTSAVWLGLGTGGLHLVVAVLTSSPAMTEDSAAGASAGATGGRIMKLRYAPHQVPVRSVEEPVGPHRAALEDADDLGGMPVVWVPLHSMVATAAAGAVAAGAGRVAHVMTDGASLAGPLSRLAATLRARGLLASTITTGQAFGGDLEAVTVHSGLLAARHVVGADVAIVADGPGNTGTATRWGSTAVASAAALNAVAALDGRPVAALRISFADPRPRHQVVSHHSLTALGRVVLTPVHVAVPAIDDDERRSAVWRALTDAGLETRHQLVEVIGGPALDLLARSGIEVESMGRGPGEDPELFLAGGAAGVLAARMAAAGRAWSETMGTAAPAAPAIDRGREP